MIDVYQIDYTGLPERSKDILERYFKQGINPGHGYFQILTNNLSAVIACDAETVADLPRIYRWLLNRAPSESWGDRDRVIAWMRDRRIEHYSPARRYV